METKGYSQNKVTPRMMTAEKLKAVITPRTPSMIKTAATARESPSAFKTAAFIEGQESPGEFSSIAEWPDASFISTIHSSAFHQKDNGNETNI